MQQKKTPNQKKSIAADWQKNWGSSVAIRVTAPILWALIFAAILVALIVQNNWVEQLEESLSANADHMAYSISRYLSNSELDKNGDIESTLTKMMAKTDFVFVDFHIGEKIYSVGEKKAGVINILRQITYSAKSDGTNNSGAVLSLYHMPLKAIIANQRKHLLLLIGVPFVLFGLALTWLISHFVTKPILELVKATKAVSEGNMSLRLPASRQDEFGQLSEFFNQMVEQVQLKQTELSQAVVEAETASESKSRFLANMSHEIRTPLTAIIGYSNLLRERDETISETQVQRHIDAILRAGDHLQEIINDILDLSKIEARQLVIESIDTQPMKVLQEVGDVIRLRTEAKGLIYKTTYNLPVPRTIKTDPTRLKQILLNLCSNAVKFTKKGSVEVVVDFDSETQLLKFSVLDEGIGMTESEMSKIFQAFTQADTSTTRQFGGSGLGLCISKQLAHKLGGEIVCQSIKGRGSSFVLSIATDDVSSKDLVTSMEEFKKISATQKNVDFPKDLVGRVLLAEDTLDNQKLLVMYICRSGATATVVENGELAVEQALKGGFDLIFMDMQMPVMGGVEATAKLRSAGYKGPIVALTANALQEDRDKCRQAGTDDYLTKPVDLDRFYAILSHYLNNSEKQKVEQETTADNEIDVEMQSLVDRYTAQLPERLNEIQAALSDEEWSQLVSYLHQLKGTGAGYGYPEITKICAELHELLIAKHYSALSAKTVVLTEMINKITLHSDSEPQAKAG